MDKQKLDPATEQEIERAMRGEDQSQKKQYRKLIFHTADELRAKDIEPVSVIIPGFLTEGTFVMGCYSNGGKTWLALQLMKSVATGVPFLGVAPARTGKVVLVELELGEKMLRERLDMLDLSGPNIVTIHSDDRTPDGKKVIPGRDENLTDYLEGLWEQVGGGIVLVVFDVWRNLKRSTPRGTDPDACIYDQISEINDFCNKHSAAAMILHHTRKANKDTALQETRTDGLAGSNALIGALKGGAWMICGKKGEQRSLYVELKASAGSDEYPVAFDEATCQWSIDGSYLDRKQEEYMNNPVRKAILALLGNDTEVKVTSQEISDQITAMNGGKRTIVTASCVGKQIPSIRGQLMSIDRVEVGERKGKIVKFYRIRRLETSSQTKQPEQETMTI